MKRRHQILGPDGALTEGDYPAEPDLDRVGIPPRLDGQTVLDVGCSDGGHSFAAESRGGVVTAIDSEESPANEGRNWFVTTRDALHSKATYEAVTLADYADREAGPFDNVMCFNVLYHVEDQLGAVEDLFTLTRPGGRLWLKTLIDSRLPERFQRLVPASWGTWGRPAFRFDEAGVEGDPTCYWAPNPAGLLALLRHAGFVDVQVRDRDVNRLYVSARRPADS